MNRMSHSSCLGVVLAGGKSSRMTTDKALLNRGDTTMLSFTAALLTQAGINDTVVSGAPHGITDTKSDLGPVGGIATVVNHCVTLNKSNDNDKPTYESLLILPVDLPLLNVNFLKILIESGEKHNKPCHFEHHVLPLYLPLTTELSEHIAALCSDAQFIANKPNKKEKTGPSIKAMLSPFEPIILTLSKSKQDLLINTNTPEQWQAVQPLINQGCHSHV